MYLHKVHTLKQRPLGKFHANLSSFLLSDFSTLSHYHFLMEEKTKTFSLSLPWPLSFLHPKWPTTLLCTVHYVVYTVSPFSTSKKYEVYCTTTVLAFGGIIFSHWLSSPLLGSNQSGAAVKERGRGNCSLRLPFLLFPFFPRS